jgi:hypothetical protein
MWFSNWYNETSDCNKAQQIEINFLFKKIRIINWYYLEFFKNEIFIDLHFILKHAYKKYLLIIYHPFYFIENSIKKR